MFDETTKISYPANNEAHMISSGSKYSEKHILKNPYKPSFYRVISGKYAPTLS